MGLSASHAQLEGRIARHRTTLRVTPDGRFTLVVVGTRRHRTLCARDACRRTSRVHASIYLKRGDAPWGKETRTVCGRCGRVWYASVEPLRPVMREATYTIDERTGRLLNITSRRVDDATHES